MQNRVLTIKTIHDAREILKQIGVSSQGVEVMAPKAVGKSVLLYNVETAAANIMKQECLIIGADCAMSRGIVEGKKKSSNLLIMGGANKLLALITRMRHYTSMGLPQIRDQLSSLRSQMLFNHSYDRGKDFLPQVMGILNVTPDSFSDGNSYGDVKEAVDHALKLKEEGASIIDIGGESTRPGSQRVSLEEELKRTIPVINALRKVSDIAISIDTYKAEVARQAIEAGANIVNDIWALDGDQDMLNVIKANPQVKICLMHMLGNPETMQDNPNYDNIINSIFTFFDKKLKQCESAGISRDRIILDPGIGFGKRQTDNLEILKRIDEFNILGCDILLGASRKSFINNIYQSEAKDRLEGTLATTAIAYNNGVEIIRVHDVQANVRFLKTLQAINNQGFNIL